MRCPRRTQLQEVGMPTTPTRLLTALWLAALSVLPAPSTAGASTSASRLATR